MHLLLVFSLVLVGNVLAKPHSQHGNGNPFVRPYRPQRPQRPGNGHGGNQGVAATTDAQCGVSTLSAPDIAHYVVGGQDAAVGQFPWQIALSSRRNVGEGSFFCGGCYIGSGKVLTAAHCVKDMGRIFATFGLHKRSDPDGAVTLRPSQTTVHENYNPMTLQHDIAVLKFDNIPSNVAAKPICLPSSSSDGQGFAVVSGWGTTDSGALSDIMQYVEKKMVPLAECKRNYMNEIVDTTMLCAGETGKDACQGDSGGPLVAFNSTTNHYVLAGVVSWGYGCGQAGYPGVYASVFNHLDWINSH